MSSASLMSMKSAPRPRVHDTQPYRSTKLHVKISEAKNLLAKDMNGLSDPYCVLVIDNEIVARTSTIWRELNPFFGEEFFVDLAQDFQEVAIYLYDQDKLKSDDTLGKLLTEAGMDNWYSLVRVCKESEVTGEVLIKLLLSETATGLDELTVTVMEARDVKDGLPDLFTIVTLDAQRVMTERSKGARYAFWNQPFKFERAKLGPELHITVRSGTALSLAQASVQTRDAIENGLVGILEELLADRDQQLGMDREQVSRTLIRILLRNNMCTPFLKLLNGIEISKCKEFSTLFRGNSMATKCTDQFMKIVGLKYLSETIKPVIDEIFREKKECEIDPTKLNSKSGKDAIHKHSLNLIRYLETIFSRIFESVERCPHIMRLVFKHLQEAVRAHQGAADPSNSATYIVVSGFLFLRFLAPAVLSPKLFGIRDELADVRTSRTLTLLAKALQIAGNLGTTIGSGKEAYMEPLYPTLAVNLDRVKHFIDRICSVKDKEEADLAVIGEEATLADVTMVEGTVLHRDATGKSFKKKDVVVMFRNLIFAPPGKPDEREVVPIASVSGVERIDASAIGQKHAMQIICSGRQSLCLALSTNLELSLWIQAFRKCLRLSPYEQLTTFHPGIYKDGKWTCCRGKGDDSPPCSKAHRSSCVDQFSDNPGPEVWVHKLFAMLLAAKSKLETKYRSQFVAEADKPRQAHVNNLLAIVEDINLSHLLHQDAPVALDDSDLM